ncbi:interferon-induced protein with tetratricopeptide repeats 2-like [Brachionichthys hirsutus]|uniref:interferon-induced protein with tetratricopeptide repeats 2-like n=1 Tax=Brachionichthys hirsutus TaxID=412623 RepID=UPI003604AB0D
MEDRLEALQCHFTWDLVSGRSKLLSLGDKLEDIGPEGGYSWLGHIYNLQGFVQHRLGFTDKARLLFCRAAEAFRQMRNTVSEEGPWLVVNYGNLAWLHHHLGEGAASRAYLSKADALLDEYPSPCEDELHPEVYAEKAWTLMKFGREQKLQAADCFRRATGMQPGRAEWNSSLVLALLSVVPSGGGELGAELWEKMRLAKERDPDNLYLAAVFLEACAKRGERSQDAARKLATRVLRTPPSSYSGIKPLLRLYRAHLSLDEAIDLAEELLERHPGERYLKRCAATCYKMKIFLDRDNPLERSMIIRAVGLHRDLEGLYPQSALKIKIDLANIYGESDRPAEADRIYAGLMESGLDPDGTQMLYNYYAKYVHFIRKDSYASIEYHMRAAEIPRRSIYRDDSVRTLERIKDRNRNQMCPKIAAFLGEVKGRAGDPSEARSGD